jgi:hypothetical protein
MCERRAAFAEIRPLLSLAVRNSPALKVHRFSRPTEFSRKNFFFSEVESVDYSTANHSFGSHAITLTGLLDSLLGSARCPFFLVSASFICGAKA